MASTDHSVAVYRELAEWYDRQGQPQLRDRFLVLAADAAQEGGDSFGAERLRQRLLQLSPHHMLKPFGTFAEALRSPDVQSYLKDLRHGYPPATADALLASLRSGKESGAGHARPVLPTAPEVDLELPLHDANEDTEPLKVYRLNEETERGSPDRTKPPRPAPLKREPAPVPRPPTSVGRSSPAPRPTPVPRAPLPPRPEPPRPAPPVLPPPELEEERARRGNWVAVALGVLVLVLGAALAGYTLARPFLNR